MIVHFVICQIVLWSEDRQRQRSLYIHKFSNKSPVNYLFFDYDHTMNHSNDFAYFACVCAQEMISVSQA